MATGYCTVEDVKHALQERFEGSQPSTANAISAIAGENDWLRKKTKRHWYDPDYSDDGTTSTPSIDPPTEPITVGGETCDIPSSPHAPHGQITHHEERRYPKTQRGYYVRVRLDRRHAQGIDSLLVREGSDFEDWVADPDKTEGRGDDYYLDVDPHTGRSAVWIDARSIAPALDYEGAVVASYTYGEPVDSFETDGFPISRAVAMRAGAELVIPQDSNVQVPDSGNLTSVKTKAEELREDADRLLKPYKATSVA
ncbi:hypothetical protein [Halococcus sp. PRR34]|uniref:hypothetical protein n=1 Tax=Halococcus sp. PRR34 TaxID=3020830 RepID=UPI002362CE69|nr:hypothetical protein [Halococcus sp. PRR34]